MKYFPDETFPVCTPAGLTWYPFHLLFSLQFYFFSFLRLSLLLLLRTAFSTPRRVWFLLPPFLFLAFLFFSFLRLLFLSFSSSSLIPLFIPSSCPHSLFPLLLITTNPHTSLSYPILSLLPSSPCPPPTPTPPPAAVSQASALRRVHWVKKQQQQQSWREGGSEANGKHSIYWLTQTQTCLVLLKPRVVGSSLPSRHTHTHTLNIHTM